jgi:hypothetical protein
MWIVFILNFSKYILGLNMSLVYTCYVQFEKLTFEMYDL